MVITTTTPHDISAVTHTEHDVMYVQMCEAAVQLFTGDNYLYLVDKLALSTGVRDYTTTICNISFARSAKHTHAVFQSFDKVRFCNNTCCH